MRTFTPAFTKAIQDEETGDPILAAIVVSHPDMGSIPDLGAPPLRLVRNYEQVISLGNVYHPYAFEIVLPDQRGDRPPVARLRFDNVDRMMIAMLRSLTTAPKIVMQILSPTNLIASPPVFDNVEVSTPDLFWYAVNYDTFTVEGTLEGPTAFRRQYPRAVMSPAVCPGLFRV